MTQTGIVAVDLGIMDMDEVVSYMSTIIKNETIQLMQGNYYAIAKRLINMGLLTPSGDIIEPDMP